MWKADSPEGTIFPRPAAPWPSKVSIASCHLFETTHDRKQASGQDTQTRKVIELEREREHLSHRQAPLPGPRPGLDTIQKLSKKRAMAPHPLNSCHPLDSFQTDPKAVSLWVAKSIPDCASPSRKHLTSEMLVKSAVFLLTSSQDITPTRIKSPLRFALPLFYLAHWNIRNRTY